MKTANILWRTFAFDYFFSVICFQGLWRLVASGCPSMGSERPEESGPDPVFTSCQAKLWGRKIALSGSYGWGDGKRMRNREETCRSDGAILVCESVICNNAPDDEAAENRRFYL